MFTDERLVKLIDFSDDTKLLQTFQEELSNIRSLHVSLYAKENYTGISPLPDYTKEDSLTVGQYLDGAKYCGTGMCKV